MTVIAHQIRYCSISEYLHDLFALNFSDKKQARWQAVTGEGGGGGRYNTFHGKEKAEFMGGGGE